MVRSPRPLRPFAGQAQLEAFSLDAMALHDAGILRLQFVLQGPLAQLRLPAPAPEPQRRDGLWASTCFEAFVGIVGMESYWEINLCPSGHWNLYALRAYRQGLRAEPSVQTLPFRRSQQLIATGIERIELQLDLDLAPLSRPLVDQQHELTLEISATAVLEHRHLGCSYWAWQHCGPQADFHRRESFLPL